MSVPSLKNGNDTEELFAMLRRHGVTRYRNGDDHLDPDRYSNAVRHPNRVVDGYRDKYANCDRDSNGYGNGDYHINPERDFNAVRHSNAVVDGYRNQHADRDLDPKRYRNGDNHLDPERDCNAV